MPKIVIAEMAYEKTMHWIKKAPGEVSGFGLTEMLRTDKGVPYFYVHDSYIMQQVNASAETEIDYSAFADLRKRLAEEGVETETRQLRWWWHSHSTMGVFWSGQDKTTIHSLAEPGWIIATVLNKKAESRSAYAQGHDEYPVALLMDEIEFIVDGQTVIDPWAEQREAWDADFQEHCKVRTYTYSGGGASGHGNFRGGSYAGGTQSKGAQTTSSSTSAGSSTGQGSLSLVSDEPDGIKAEDRSAWRELEILVQQCTEDDQMIEYYMKLARDAYDEGYPVSNISQGIQGHIMQQLLSETDTIETSVLPS